MTKLIPESEKATPRLTAAQWRMLRAVARTGDAFSHLSGRSERGGGVGTHVALCRHGLLDMNGLTAAGRARLVCAGRPPRGDRAIPGLLPAGQEEGVMTKYTRAELSTAIDQAHDLLHGGHADAAHDVLHSVGAGFPRVGCATRDPEVQRVAAEWIAKLEGTGLPCGHRLADLVGGKGSVTKCGACLAERLAQASGKVGG